jgi:hypothetical protein
MLSLFTKIGEEKELEWIQIYILAWISIHRVDGNGLG